MQQLLILTKQKLFDKIARLKVNIWRVVRVVEGAALEMLCPERDLGFESLTLRQIRWQGLIDGLLPFLFYYKRLKTLENKGIWGFYNLII